MILSINIVEFISFIPHIIVNTYFETTNVIELIFVKSF